MKKSFLSIVSIGYYLFLVIGSVLIILLLIGFFTQKNIPAEVDVTWWTALGAIAVITIAILIMNFIRESEYKEFINKINEYKNDIENTKKLSTLSTILLNITSDDINPRNRKKENLNIISDLYKSKFINSEELGKISSRAISQDNYEFAYQTRKLIFDNDKKNIEGKLIFLSYLSYFNLAKHEPKYLDPDSLLLLNNKDRFLEEIGFRNTKNSLAEQTEFNMDNYSDAKFKAYFKDRSNISFAYAIVGRYLFVHKEMKGSKRFFELAIKQSDSVVNWHLRYAIMINFILQENTMFEEHLYAANSNKDWIVDYRYLAYSEFFSNISGIINKKKDHIIVLNSMVYNQALHIKDSERFSMWNFASLLMKINNIDDNKKAQLKELYHIFYLFFCIDDNSFEDIYEYTLDENESNKEMISHKERKSNKEKFLNQIMYLNVCHLSLNITDASSPITHEKS